MVVVNGNTGKVVGRFRFEFGYIIRVGHGEAEDEWEEECNRTRRR